jgi:beta-glucosidase
MKYSLNLFEKPVTYAAEYPEFGSKAYEKTAYDLACESITLLKNENNILPLNKSSKVLVTGPNANSMRTLNGGWSYSWQGERADAFATEYNTILEALQKKLGDKNVTYIPGVSYKSDGKYYEEYKDKMEEAVAAAKNADAIILCLGENSYTEKPGDLHDLYISELQTEFALKLTAAGKPVILVLNEGRPRVIGKFESQTAAVIQTYLPGNFGGDALADILTGDVNPSGKLPYTYPRFPNSTIPYYHKPSEEQRKAEGVYNYEADYNPQYEFGFGLSYSTFEYSNLTTDKSEYSGNENMEVKVTVKNTGKVKGKETVFLYTADMFASLTPDMKRLRRFEKTELQPGEEKTITFTLTPEDLSFIKSGGKRVTEAGEFEIQIGDLKTQINLLSGKTF